ncbi:MAG: vWA domain-containing protein [Planctomycetaceae bacterium]
MPAPSAKPSSEISRGLPRDDAWGLLASTSLHVAVIAAMSCVWIPATETRVPPAVQTQFDDAAEETEIPPEILQLPLLPSSQAGGRQVIARPSVDKPTSEPQVHFDDRVAATSGELVENVDLRETVRLAPASASTGLGSGTGNGVGNGSGQGADYFQLDNEPGRYVFVVDASRSMNFRYPGPARSRFGRLKIELWRTIYRMSSEQKYFVIFFNTRSFPMPATELRPGGTENQDDLFKWTAELRAGGKTDPLDAMLMAMRMQPDVIYFLTDGEFNYRVVREVAKANTRGIRINTISLGDDAGGKFLEEIATTSGGTYRHIIQEEDHYWVEAASTAPPEETAATVP